jgi:spoIIIJ-associated protein
MASGEDFEGRDIEEALDRAQAALGRRPGDQEYEVVKEARRGFFGFGAHNVRIHVLAPLPSKQAAPASGSSRSSAGKRPSAGSSEPGTGVKKKPPASPGSSELGTGVKKKPPASPGSSEPGAADDEAGPGLRHEAVREVAGTILNKMKLELTARLRDREGSVFLEIGGRDARLLLENEGEGLAALQHVLNKILARDEESRTRVFVDSEGFRSRRDSDLVQRAVRLATEVRRSGRGTHIDGLNPYERRLIHVALAEEEGVRTFSEGEGQSRRLTIEPARPDPSARKA